MLFDCLLTRHLSTDNAGAFSEKDNDDQQAIEKHRRPDFQASWTASQLCFGQPDQSGICSLPQSPKSPVIWGILSPRWYKAPRGKKHLTSSKLQEL
jgi:hypothetical protein